MLFGRSSNSPPIIAAERVAACKYVAGREPWVPARRDPRNPRQRCERRRPVPRAGGPQHVARALVRRDKGYLKRARCAELHFLVHARLWRAMKVRGLQQYLREMQIRR